MGTPNHAESLWNTRPGLPRDKGHLRPVPSSSDTGRHRVLPPVIRQYRQHAVGHRIHSRIEHRYNMNQEAGDRDVLGGTIDPDHIIQLLQDNTYSWYNSASNAPPPSGSNPLEPIRPPSDPGRQYDDLASLDLNSPSPNPDGNTVDTFVLPQMGEPDFVTNRDRNVAFHAQTRRRPGRHPIKGHSLLPTHNSPMEDHDWLTHNGAQIFSDPHNPQITRDGKSWATRARYIHNDHHGVHYLVDYTRIDTATYPHIDPHYRGREQAQSTRWVSESFRTVESELDLARSMSPGGWPPGLPPPMDFHRPYSIQEEPPDGRSSIRRSAGWRESEQRDRDRRSQPSSPKQSRRRRPSFGNHSQQSASSAASARTQRPRPGRWGQREQYIRQQYSTDEHDDAREVWERRDEGEAYGFPGGPFRWRSDLRGSSKNADLDVSS